MKAYLTLENGTVFEGTLIGAQGETSGEIVFSTTMGSYIEALTDPASYGQILVQTFPLIGNYGIIYSDMESDKVMDRLLCGDVGFGKTEVALRACFKAILDGKQVAFIAPTTIFILLTNIKIIFSVLVEINIIYNSIKTNRICFFESLRRISRIVWKII